jgi:threonyl-tRNA synthetase
MERFFGTLIEYHSGNFPLWLCPVQVKILPISDKYLDKCKEIDSAMRKAGIRSEVDSRAEKIGYKIREAEMKKIPYMCIVGEKEVENNTLSVRRHTEGDVGSFSLEEFINKMKEEITDK